MVGMWFEGDFSSTFVARQARSDPWGTPGTHSPLQHPSILLFGIPPATSPGECCTFWAGTGRVPWVNSLRHSQKKAKKSMSSYPLVNLTPGMLLSSASCPSQLKNHLQKLFLFCSIYPALLCKHPQFWHVVEVMTQLHYKSKENIKLSILTPRKRTHQWRAGFPPHWWDVRQGKHHKTVLSVGEEPQQDLPHGSAHLFPLHEGNTLHTTGCNQWIVPNFLHFPFQNDWWLLSTSICCLCSMLNVGKSHQ